jgi:Ser/Thr protein kinase RdoA (MazF antagonist)
MAGDATIARAERYRRERRLAELALGDYGLAGSALRLLKYSSTALFRVDAGEPLILRLHPPERHPTPVIRSELDWLAALRRQTNLLVPEPVAAPDGRLLVEIHSPELGETRRAALFRWLPGRHKPRSLTSADAGRLGLYLARLHRFAEQYRPPPDFVRWEFDWGEFAASTVERPRWPARLAKSDHALMHAAIDRVRRAMDELGQRSDAWGLIHADTNLSNFLFQREAVALIDFEVCCYGYYLFDVTRTLLEFEMYGERAAALATAFHRSYRNERALPELDHPYMVAFRIMNVVDVIVWILDWGERMPLATGPRRVAAALERLRQLAAPISTQEPLIGG